MRINVEWYNLQLFAGSPVFWERVDLSNRHELLNSLVGDLFAFFLEFSDKLLEAVNQKSLDFASEHFTFAVLHAHFLQLLVIVQEELQILERNIHLEVGTIGPMFLDGGPAARLGIFIDLAFDLGGRVSQQNGRGHI